MKQKDVPLVGLLLSSLGLKWAWLQFCGGCKRNAIQRSRAKCLVWKLRQNVSRLSCVALITSFVPSTYVPFAANKWYVTNHAGSDKRDLVQLCSVVWEMLNSLLRFGCYFSCFSEDRSSSDAPQCRPFFDYDVSGKQPDVPCIRAN